MHYIERGRGPSWVPKRREMKTYVDGELSTWSWGCTAGLTYFSKGKSVRDHIMALIPPMTSSSEGTSPVLGQIPFKTYNGEVPISE